MNVIWEEGRYPPPFLPDHARHNRRETPTEPPNYFVRDTRSGRTVALTDFADPAPQMRGIRKQLVTYERADGVPLNGRQLHLYIMPEEVPAGPRATTDASGTFQIDGVLAGCEYRLLVSGSEGPGMRMGMATVANPLAVRPGETVDLGKKTVKMQ